MQSEQVVSVGRTAFPITHQVVALNLELVANQLMELDTKLPKSPLPKYAYEFDLKKMLACIAKFLANCNDSVDNWHKIFADKDYRQKMNWEKLKELYWSNEESLEKTRLSQYTLNVYESYFVNEFQPILSAYFIKLSEAKGLNDGLIPVELKDKGMPWIEGNFLIWGQPLSLCEELCSFYPKAICGANQTEPFSKFFARNCAKYKIKILPLSDSSDNEKTEICTASSLKRKVYELMANRERRKFWGIALKTNTAILEEHLRMAENSYYAFLKKEAAEETMRSFLGGTLIEQNEKVVKIFQAIHQFAQDGSDSKLAETAREVIGRPAVSTVAVIPNSASGDHSVDVNIGGHQVAERKHTPANNDGQAELSKKRKLSNSPPVARKMSNLAPIAVAEKQLAKSRTSPSASELNQTGNTSILTASNTGLVTDTKPTDSQLTTKVLKVKKSVLKRKKRSSRAGTNEASSKSKTSDFKAKKETTKTTKKVKKRESTSSSSSSDSSSSSSSSETSSSSESSSSDSEQPINLPDDQSRKSVQKAIQTPVV